MGRSWSGTYRYHSLLSSYVNQTTTHGVRKITSSRHPVRRTFWICVFLTSLSACCYHCSYLIMLYLSNPKVTITDEIDAAEVEFPSVTICNLNAIKRMFADEYFEMASKQVTRRNTSRCYGSEEDLAKRSSVDLSDTWLNLAITKENLSIYGHKISELLIQCTYNSNDCFSGKSFQTIIKDFPSPVFGLCHIISIQNRENGKPVVVKRGGTTNGLRLTLNIERDKYWDLISPEYGIRLYVHPQGTYPTLQRGGIIVGPGRSAHIGVKRRISSRLPGREGSCMESFRNSELSAKLDELGFDFDLIGIKYTYESCNRFCQNVMLFQACNCSDEQPNASEKGNWRYCSPCNKAEYFQDGTLPSKLSIYAENGSMLRDKAEVTVKTLNKYRYYSVRLEFTTCRTDFLRHFLEAGNLCDDMCKPSCNSVRFTISLSKADWPNLDHQQFVMNRSRDQWANIPEALGLLSLPFEDENVTEFINETFFSENLLRVHIYLEEMIYLSIQERYSYTLPKLLADLGGCLGLYLGVSVISLIELVELFGGASLICFCRFKNPSESRSSDFSRTRFRSKRKRRNKGGRSALCSGISGFGTPLGFKKKKNHKTEGVVWRPPFAAIDPYYEDENMVRRNDLIRRF